MIECPRVVIDTNLVLSALVFGGRLSRLRLAWQNNRFIPLASEVTIAELVRVLTYPKFKLTNSEQEDLLSDYLPFCDTVLIPDTLPVVPECRDPFDIPFLLLAVVSQADYLVTGDGDLLCLSDNFSCPILTIDEFLTAINYQSL
ncbi:putative toxin-antitoxin system toxin component, PIN family [Kamptonema sp. UHCC 0994]|uniref:putative toxin-antitoxin system toxin component, PIN family n=1 Tax=Kamptonema sp. UHCC 0994 TaxID=3031329 RepID=UPI0023B89DC4|nr:putative toxin-antitoxin system toxin component, PIN family [Kamptonema sp. UHCC 0994]MDF0555883.1 putative toxin-antitoxin system toxin component, PIN family [Kamptonema sp. UHCC 0994]